MSDITQTPAWQALVAHRASLAAFDLREAFRAQSDRFSLLAFERNGLLLDLSKQRISEETLALLTELASAAALPDWTERLFGGDKINTSEGRAVLHTALRQGDDAPIIVDGADILPAIRAAQTRMRGIAERLRRGAWAGATGKAIANVVNIGIGGSDLGPRLVCEALAHLRSRDVGVHFVSNVDPADLGALLAVLDPQTTLFIVTSKTFTTQETLRNALSARQWLAGALPANASLAQHFIAVTANVAAARDFGVAGENVLPMWDWVGGRYSLWSAVGLPIVITVGWDEFARLLAGAADIDTHFRSAPLAKNLPVLLGLVDLWNVDFWNADTKVVAPYAQALARLPAYLQQAEMESNGKRAGRDGQPVACATAPAIWGEPGTNGQHAFFQWLHQGTNGAPVDFVVPVKSAYALPEHQNMLLANALAQTQALLQGRGEDQVRRELAASGVSGAALAALAPQKTFPGNRPSTTILLRALDAFHLGQLLALYEHKIFVQGVIWGINSFDQWGVELGKTLAKPIYAALAHDAPLVEADGSTRGLLDTIREYRRS